MADSKPTETKTIKKAPAKAAAKPAPIVAKATAAAPVVASPPVVAQTVAPSVKAEPAPVVTKAVEMPAPVAAKPVVAEVAKAADAPAEKILPKAKPAQKPAAPKIKKAAPVAAKQSRTPEKPVAVAAKTIPVATATIIEKKDKLMATVETITADTTKMAEDLTARVKGAFGEFGEKAKTAFEKGSEMAAKAGDFSKANLEALVESGKIASKGAQDMTKSYVEEVKTTYEEATESLKKLAAVKSPTEFMQLQTEMLKASFDKMVASTSKNSEAVVKLAGEVFQPISNRASVAMESFKKAA